MRSIWTHPHFVFAVVAQFLYVAAQAGIFSFLINYMIAEVPAMPAVADKITKDWINVRTDIVKPDIRDLPSLVERLKSKNPGPGLCFVISQLSDNTATILREFKLGTSDPETLRSKLVQI